MKTGAVRKGTQMISIKPSSSMKPINNNLFELWLLKCLCVMNWSTVSVKKKKNGKQLSVDM